MATIKSFTDISQSKKLAERLPLDFRLKHNEQVERERKEWHKRNRGKSNEYREAYEFIEAREKEMGDQMTQVFQSVSAAIQQIEQGIEPHPLKQEPEPKISQPLQQGHNIFDAIASPFGIGFLAMMFIAPEDMQKALKRMQLCKEIFDADQEFQKRKYPISGWEI